MGLAPVSERRRKCERWTYEGRIGDDFFGVETLKRFFEAGVADDRTVDEVKTLGAVESTMAFHATLQLLLKPTKEGTESVLP